MKCWAVFNTPTYYPAGGMSDFVAAFDTKGDAEAFVENSLDSEYWSVEDMTEYLDRESPPIPAAEDQEAAVKKRREEREAQLASLTPIQREIYEATKRVSQQLARDLFGED